MFENIVNLAREYNYSNRSVEAESCSDVVRYYSMYCTVHVNVGRGSGKTKYIVDNAEKNDVIFTFSQNSKKTFSELSKTKNIFCDVRECVGLDLEDIDFVYVDEPKICLEKYFYNIFDIYRLFRSTKKEITFILLGE